MNILCIILIITAGVIFSATFLATDDTIIAFGVFFTFFILLGLAAIVYTHTPVEPITEEETIPSNIITIRSGDTLLDVSTEKFYLYKDGKFYEEVE